MRSRSRFTPLVHSGVHVVGIDLRRLFIERSRRRARREGLQIELRVENLRYAEIPEGEFHGIYNWFYSFGYFSDQQNLDLIDRYAKGLRPGGRLLIDQLNRERILRNFRKQHEIGEILFKSRWDSRKGRMHLRRIVNGIDEPRNRSSQRWYTPREMKRLVERVGLKIENTYGSISGEPFHRSSAQMITVAIKPG